MDMTEKDFSLRLAQLREEKGVSARDMSLSMGQNPGYINNIESGKSMPSLSGIFYICEYLEITPKDFFDVETSNPTKATELYNIAKKLDSEQLDHLIALEMCIRDRARSFLPKKDKGIFRSRSASVMRLTPLSV